MTDFIAENELEAALVKAANDPANAPAFYRELIDGVVYFIQQQIATDDGNTVGIASIEVDGTNYLPIFSAVSRIQKVIDHEVTYAGVNGKEFLQMTAGSPILLNPGSDYGKEILPDEAAAIVDGSIFNMAEKQTLPKDTTYIIGDPKNYPTELVDALSALFRKSKQVKRAWLAQLMLVDAGDEPSTLIGIEADTEIGAIAEAAHHALQQIDIPNPPVDFVAVTAGAEFSDYFLEQKPFYSQSLMRRLF